MWCSQPWQRQGNYSADHLREPGLGVRSVVYQLSCKGTLLESLSTGALDAPPRNGPAAGQSKLVQPANGPRHTQRQDVVGPVVTRECEQPRLPGSGRHLCLQPGISWSKCWAQRTNPGERTQAEWWRRRGGAQQPREQHSVGFPLQGIDSALPVCACVGAVHGGMDAWSGACGGAGVVMEGGGP